MRSTCDPDSSRFVRAFVERRGGIAEIGDDRRADLALSPGLACTLGVSEFAPGVEIGFGTPLLERALAEVRRGTTLAAASVEGLRLKSDGVAALAERRLRAGNARLRAAGVTRARTATLLLALRYEAASDEAREGLVPIAIDLGDLTAVPDVLEHLSGLELGAARGGTSAGAPPAQVAAAVLRDAAPRIESELKPFSEAMQRRLGRDAARVRGYYDGLLAELNDPRRRRRGPVDAAEAERRRAEERRAIETERERKLLDAQRRYAVRIDVRVAGALRLEHDEVSCFLELKRRERERRIRVGWSPFLRDLKPLVCERCLRETTAFDVCDDALHILCGRCASRACPVCARG